MTTITFNVVAFRTEFPAFQFQPPTDGTLQSYWDMATTFISDQDNSCYALSGLARVLALNLLTAHLAALMALIAKGENPGLETSATIDKVSVTLTPPPVKSQFGWWLSLTPYGAQLLALLQVAGVGGFYVGGLPERSGFRKVGGIF